MFWIRIRLSKNFGYESKSDFKQVPDPTFIIFYHSVPMILKGFPYYTGSVLEPVPVNFVKHMPVLLRENLKLLSFIGLHDQMSNFL
jgi:hypothetical protein